MIATNQQPDPVRITCSECSERRKAETQEKIKGQPPEFFIGSWVKLAFPCDGECTPDMEHMWVKVIEIYQGDEKEELVGVLDNDPLFITDYHRGDGVAFKRSEIEDFFFETKGTIHA